MIVATSGTNNVGVGYNALFKLTTGSQNVAVGRAALQNITTVDSNVAVGWHALRVNTAEFNVAVGADAVGAAGNPPRL